MVMIKNKLRNTDIYKRFGGDAIDKIRQKIKNEEVKGSKYMSGQLCKFIDKLPKYREKHKSTHGGKFILKTPFGIVQALKRSENEVFITGAGKYKDLVGRIKKQGENKPENIRGIYNYLSILNDSNIKDIPQFNKKKVKIIKYNKALAGLCAILMIAEPYRFKDGGGLSRGYIRKAFSDISYDDNALDRIFGSKGKKFRGTSEADAPFAHYDLGPKNMNRKLEKGTLGGKLQTNNLIHHNFDENYDLKNESKESIKDNKERLDDANSYISDDEDINEKLIYFIKKRQGVKTRSQTKNKKNLLGRKTKLDKSDKNIEKEINQKFKKKKFRESEENN